MKTVTTLTLLLLLMYLQCVGQSTDFENYLNNNAFLNQLDQDFINYEVHKNLIKTITEIRITLDEKGNENDSSTLYKYHFDQIGQLIEKQYRFSDNNKKFISHKFIYIGNNEKIDTIKLDPYPPVYVLDGEYRKVSSKYIKYDRNQRIEKVEIEFYHGELKYLNIEYEYSLGLLQAATVYTDKGKYRHEFKYEYYQKYKH